MWTGKKFPHWSSRSRTKPGRYRSRVTLLPLKAQPCFPMVKEGYKAEKVKEKPYPCWLQRATRKMCGRTSSLWSMQQGTDLEYFCCYQMLVQMLSYKHLWRQWDPNAWWVGKVSESCGVYKFLWKELGLLFSHFTFNIFSDYQKHMPTVKRKNFYLIIQSYHCSCVSSCNFFKGNPKKPQQFLRMSMNLRRTSRGQNRR